MSNIFCNFAAGNGFSAQSMKRLTNILFLLVPLWCLFSYAQTPFDSFAPDFILWICVTVVSLIPYYHFMDGAIFGAEYFNPNSEQTLGEQLEQYLNDVLQATEPFGALNYNELPIDDNNKRPTHRNTTTKPMFTYEDH